MSGDHEWRTLLRSRTTPREPGVHGSDHLVPITNFQDPQFFKDARCFSTGYFQRNNLQVYQRRGCSKTNRDVVQLIENINRSRVRGVELDSVDRITAFSETCRTKTGPGADCLHALPESKSPMRRFYTPRALHQL